MQNATPQQCSCEHGHSIRLNRIFPLQRYDISPKPPRKLVYKKFTFSFVSNKQFTNNLQIGLTAHHSRDFQKPEKRTVQIVKTRFLYDLKQIVWYGHQQKSRAHALPFCCMWLIQVLKLQKIIHLFVHFKKTYYLCAAKTVEWFDNFCSTCISNYDYQERTICRSTAQQALE